VIDVSSGRDFGCRGKVLAGKKVRRKDLRMVGTWAGFSTWVSMV